MKKKAWVRSDKEIGSRCPFGLPITEACSCAGSSVTHMCPLSFTDESKKENIKKANKRVYIYYKNGNRCLYAANIMKDFNSVNCDFGDTAQGLHMSAINGSPLYAQTFSGIGLDGLYAFPLGFYADNNESRNLFQGLFSLVGNKSIEIIKKAISEGSCTPCLLKEYEDNGDITSEERQELEDFLEQCRYNYEHSTTNTHKVIELADKFNPRKKL